MVPNGSVPKRPLHYITLSHFKPNRADGRTTTSREKGPLFALAPGDTVLGNLDRPLNLSVRRRGLFGGSEEVWWDGGHGGRVVRTVRGCGRGHGRRHGRGRGWVLHYWDWVSRGVCRELVVRDRGCGRRRAKGGRVVYCGAEVVGRAGTAEGAGDVVGASRG